MQIIIIAFDGLDKFLVEKFNCEALKQSVYGTTILENWTEKGGHPDYLTDEIFATFITGQIPHVHKVQIPIALDLTLEGKIPTIFDLCDSVAVDVPSWNRNPDQSPFQTRVGQVLQGDGDIWKLRDDSYRYLTDKLIKTMDTLVDDRPLTMIYFWFTDIIGHVTKGGPPLEFMYEVAERVFRFIKTLTKDELVMVMSDHGMFEANHRPEGAFWSLSKPLLENNQKVLIEDWYNILKKWLNV